MRLPHPGELRHRIDLGITVSTINANGFPVDTDTVIATVWASVEDASSKWFHSGDADQAQRGLSFIIRWRNDIRPGMWVAFDGKRYAITGTGEYDFRKRYLLLNTQCVEGVL